MQSATQTEDGKLVRYKYKQVVHSISHYLMNIFELFLITMYCALRFKKQDRIMTTTLLRKLWMNTMKLWKGTNNIAWLIEALLSSFLFFLFCFFPPFSLTHSSLPITLTFLSPFYLFLLVLCLLLLLPPYPFPPSPPPLALPPSPSPLALPLWPFPPSPSPLALPP